VSGSTAITRPRFGPVPPARAIHLLRQICHSLADAHSRGLVHRDVKPANIYVGRLGLDHDFVKVLDFGLVKSEDSPSAGDSRLTAEGITSGTPAYMAPEIALGEGRVDGRADIYALGCVAYWLVTGVLVFDSDTPMKVLLDHVQTPPVPPSSRTELDVPADLERVILACLEKKPEDRPARASELGRLLDACADAGAWTDEAASRWWTLHLPATAARTNGAPTAELGTASSAGPQPA
jgi:serine/threonine-protein kinase